MSWALTVTGMGMGLAAYGGSQQRKELGRREDVAEAKIKEEMAFKRSVAADKGNEILRASNYAKGSARAIQATSGTAVGEGSNIPQVDQITAMARKKIETLEKRLGFEGISAIGEIDEIGHRTDAAIDTSYWQQGATMLNQGWRLGVSQGWWGAGPPDTPPDVPDTPPDTFTASGQSGFDSSGGLSGLSGQGYWSGGL